MAQGKLDFAFLISEFHVLNVVSFGVEITTIHDEKGIVLLE